MTCFKSLKLVLLPLAIVLVSFSCEKSEMVDAPPALTEEEAFEILKSEMDDPKSGISNDLEMLIGEFIDFFLQGEYCNVPYNFEIDLSEDNQLFAASFAAAVSGEVTCNFFNIPQTATIQATASTFVSAPDTRRINYNGDLAFAGDVTGLQLLSPFLNVAGSFNRTGSFTWELNDTDQIDVSTNLSMALTDFTIVKIPPFPILSGVGSLTFEAMVGDQLFPFDGSITFNGDNTLTLLVNGEAFFIDLN